MKKKIALLFAGGTIGMVPDSETGALKPADRMEDLLRSTPELKEVVDLDFELVFNRDSSNLQPFHWTQLAERVSALYALYDGFVIAHGTDTMAYTASALSFALQNLAKPVVFTGSLIPMSQPGSDARNNLVYACLTSGLDLGEVCIVMADRILRGNRARKRHESFTAGFHSPNFPELGELGRPINLYEWRTSRRDAPLVFGPSFDSNIVLYKIFPGFSPETMERAIDRGVNGVVIEGFGPGNVPFLENSLAPALKKARDAHIPVLLCNQMEKGITNLNSYESGSILKGLSVVSAKDMTTEAAVAKLMWVLANESSFEARRTLLESNLAGELRE